VSESEACKNCGEAAAEGGYKQLLCASCRDTFARRPLPSWIRGSSVAISLVVLFALARFPLALKADLAFERGNRASAAGNYRLATAEYGIAAAQYPDSLRILPLLAIASYRAGDWEVTAASLRKLSGRELTPGEAAELNQIVHEMDQKMKARSSSAGAKGKGSQ
jgi:hypothetical protein